MSARANRIIIDTLVTTAVLGGLYFAGAGLWALVILPYGFWNFYDGQTRRWLWRRQ